MRANRLLFIALLLTIAAFSYSALAEIHFGGNEYSKVYIGGQEISKAQIAGNEFFAKAPSGPTHTFSITVGGRGSTRGYNAIAGWGSLATGSTATYTANGKSLTVIHARRLNNDFVFGLSGAAAVAADFPSRIVATKTTRNYFYRYDGSEKPRPDKDYFGRYPQGL